MKLADLEFSYPVVAHSGSAPWLGAEIRLTEPLTTNPLNAFGRFDTPDRTVYLYVTSTATWDRDGHLGAVVQIRTTRGDAPARPPRRRASQIPGFSLPSEAVLSDDLSLKIPFELLGFDRRMAR